MRIFEPFPEQLEKLPGVDQKRTRGRHVTGRVGLQVAASATTDIAAFSVEGFGGRAGARICVLED